MTLEIVPRISNVEITHEIYPRIEARVTLVNVPRINSVEMAHKRCILEYSNKSDP